MCKSIYYIVQMFMLVKRGTKKRYQGQPWLAKAVAVGHGAVDGKAVELARCPRESGVFGGRRHWFGPCPL